MTPQTKKWVSIGSSVILVAIVVGLWQKGHLHSWMKPGKTEEASKKPTAQIENSDDSAYQMVIKGRLAEVQACYNQELKKGVSKAGKLVVQWTVNPEGKAEDFKEELNELESSELYDCTTQAIANWPFPKDQVFQIRYTFKMREIEKPKMAAAREVAGKKEKTTNVDAGDEVLDQLGEL